MKTTPNRTLEKVFLIAAVLIVASISIPSYLIVHKATAAAASTVDKRADGSSGMLSGIFSPKVPVEANEVVAQAAEIKRALEKYAETTGARNGAEVTFSEIAPFLAGNSHVRALNGVDDLGGKWGPFRVGEPVYPAESTMSHFSSAVKPEFWKRAEGEMR